MALVHTAAVKNLRIRYFDSDADDIEALTELLHTAYMQLEDMGLLYLATHQDTAVTKSRIEGGHCIVGEMDGRLVSTVTFYEPGIKSGCAWYCKDGVGVFGQFGVLPEFQGVGMGSQLLRRVEQLARQTGCRELALDTAEPAIHLHQYYERRGYRVVDGANWEGTNYKSVIMSKTM